MTSPPDNIVSFPNSDLLRLKLVASTLLEALKPLAYGWTIGCPEAHAAAVKNARAAIALAKKESTR